MQTVTLKIASREKVNKRFLEACKGKSQGSFISFDSPAVLFKVISGHRWELLKMMTGAGAISIREASRRLGRDIKAVHGDMSVLLKAGILHKTDDGQIEFPFDAIHVDFLLQAA
jgi:predicted transcriptional regulator